MDNPFSLSAYYGPDLFCDREKETQQLVENCRNGANTLLLSLRRMGKTGLIHHLVHTLKEESDVACVYLDIYPSRNLKDLTDALANAVLEAFPTQHSIGRKFMTLISSMRPTVTFDPLSGVPQFSFDFSRDKDYESSLHAIFSFLESRSRPIFVAIDEFQQISQYPERNMEALLRSLIQPLKNIQFVFSGSSTHMLSEMFHSIKRPFFSSAQQIFLAPIERQVYHRFIAQHFSARRRTLDKEAIDFILDWSRQHTYYTQVVCNRLFAKGLRKISAQEVRKQCASLLKEQEHVFFQYRQLITPIQWNLLKAIAKEDMVFHTTSKSFIGKYDIGTAANIQRALQALLDKEMIYRHVGEEGSYVRVYDTFLARWLQYLPD